MDLPEMERRTFLKGLGAAGLALAAGSQPALAATAADSDEVHAYVGAWNGHGGKPGLWQYSFNQSTGKMKMIRQINDQIACGWIYIDRRSDGVYFHCTDETDLPLGKHHGGGGGRVYSYKVDTGSGALTQVNIKPSYGGDPSMVWVDPTGKYLVCCHHTAGGDVCLTKKTEHGYEIVSQGPDANLVLFPLHADGVLGDPVDIITLPDGASLHGCEWAPTGKFFIVPDIGLSKVYSYKIDYAAKKFVPVAKPWDDLPGAATRYAKFHPTQPWVYLNHENSACNESWVYALRYDATGKLTKINGALAVPGSWQSRVAPGASFQQQDLKINADGTFLYSVYRAGLDVLSSNGAQSYVKGFDGVAVFSIDQKTGALTHLQSLNLDCEWARGGSISPDGNWFVVAALYSNDLITLKIGSDGRLSKTGIVTKQTTASNVTFYTPGAPAIGQGVTNGFY